MKNYAAYRVSEETELSPETFNPRFLDLDNRLHELEDAKVDWLAAVANLADVGLERIDEALLPAVEQLAQVLTLGAFFSTTSTTSHTIGTGTKAFTVPAADRQNFAPASYLQIWSTGTADQSMVGTLVSYDSTTGLLTVDIDQTFGAGTYNDWAISVGARPQTGSYTIAEADAAIAAAIATVLGDAAVDFDTLGEAEDRILALESDKADLNSPQLVTPQILNSDNTATLQEAVEFLRGTGAGKKIQLQTLGDASNGVVGVALVDVDSGDKLMEVGADGYVSALTAFKANGIVLPRILGLWQPTLPGATATRTASTLAWSFAFPALWLKDGANSKLIIDGQCLVNGGNGTSNHGAGWVYAGYYNGSGWTQSQGDLIGPAVTGTTGDMLWARSIYNRRHVWDASAVSYNSSQQFRFAIGTSAYAGSVDVTWSEPGVVIMEVLDLEVLA